METSDLVLEGGGVKGAGLAGAVHVLADHYQFHRVAGTSAGTIVASLVAAGLGDRLEALTIDTDFADFLDEGAAARLLGPLGNGIDLLAREGIHRGRALHRWIEDTLDGAGVQTFGDLRLPAPRPGLRSSTAIASSSSSPTSHVDGCFDCPGTTSGCWGSPPTRCRSRTPFAPRPRSRSSSGRGSCRSTPPSPTAAPRSC